MSDNRFHTLSVEVENRPGVLSRVAGLFSRRGFNIYSLAVAPTHDDRFSRITIVVYAESAPMEQITKQLNKLINVVKITELDPDESVALELMLITVGAGLDTLIAAGVYDETEGLRLSDQRSSRLRASSDTQTTFSVANHPLELDRIEGELAQFEIVAVQRSGLVALPKVAGTN